MPSEVPLPSLSLPFSVPGFYSLPQGSFLHTTGDLGAHLAGFAVA